MRVGNSVNELSEVFGCSVATVGNFDGLHLGHRRILSRVKDKAVNLDCSCMLITFEPPPFNVIHPERNISRLTTLEKKLALIEECGMDAVLILEFTASFAKKGHKEFVKEVLLPLRVRELFVGHDFAFGAGRKGNVNALAAEGKIHGFGVYEIEEVKAGEENVRSTAIRNAILKGEVETAMRLLARPHSIRGKVVSGAGRGAQLGFRTANIETPPETVPGSGVYATKTKWRNTLYDSASHIGGLPTFDIKTSSIETHLLEFDKDIKGDDIEILFFKKLRDIVKFDSPEALSRQIKLDIEAAKDVLKNQE